MKARIPRSQRLPLLERYREGIAWGLVMSGASSILLMGCELADIYEAHGSVKGEALPIAGSIEVGVAVVGVGMSLLNRRQKKMMITKEVPLRLADVRGDNCARYCPVFTECLRRGNVISSSTAELSATHQTAVSEANIRAQIATENAQELLAECSSGVILDPEAIMHLCSSAIAFRYMDQGI